MRITARNFSVASLLAVFNINPFCTHTLVRCSNPMTVNELLGGFQKLAGGKALSQKKKMKVKDARPLIEEMELEKVRLDKEQRKGWGGGRS